MPANSTLSLLIETQTTGTAEVAKLENAIARLSDRNVDAASKMSSANRSQADSVIYLASATETAHQKQQASVSKLAEVHKSAFESISRDIGAAVRDSLAFGAGVAIATKAIASQTTAVGLWEASINRVRAARVGLAAVTEGAGGALTVGLEIGAVLAFEKALTNTYARAEQLQRQAIESQKTGLNYQRTVVLDFASQRSGLDPVALAAGIKASGGDIDQFAQKLRDLGKIQDPIEKVHAAFLAFGPDAERFLPLLGDRFADNIVRAREWGLVLSDESRKNISNFKSDVDSLASTFTGLGDSLKAQGEGIRVYFASAFGSFYGFVRDAGGLVAAALAKIPRPPVAITNSTIDLVSAQKQIQQGAVGQTQLLASQGLIANLSGPATKFFTADHNDRDTRESALKEDVKSLQGSIFDNDPKSANFGKPVPGATFAGGPSALALAIQKYVSEQNALVQIAKEKADEAIADALKREQEAQQKSITEALRAAGEEEGIRKLFPNGLSASERKVLEFTKKPGVSDEQVKEFSDTLLPERTRESQLALNNARARSLENARKNNEELLRRTDNPKSSASDREFLDNLRRQDKQHQDEIEATSGILSVSRQTDLSQREGSIRLQGTLAQQGPDNDLRVAAQLAAAKKDYLSDELKVQLDLTSAEFANSIALEDKLKEAKLKNAYEVSQVEIELSQQVADEARRQKEQSRNLSGGFFDAAVSRRLPQFFQSQGQDIGRTVFQNATSGIFGAAKLPLTSDPNSQLGKPLAGTPFGVDPLQSATKLNIASTDLNTKATVDLTSAIAYISTGGTAGSLPGGGTGTRVGAGGSSPLSVFGSDTNGITGQGSIFDLPIGISPAIASIVNQVPGLASGGGLQSAQSILKTIPQLAKLAGITGAIDTVGTGRAQTGAAGSALTPRFTTSGLIGTGVQAGAGALELASGLNTGGVRGGLNAAGGAAAIAGSVLPLLASSLALAGPIGAAVGAGLALVSSFFGDPKTIRQTQISKTAENNQFYTPEARNLSEGVGGGYSDYNRYGDVRSSNISPYPSVSEPYYLFRQHVLIPGTTNSQFGGPSGGQTVTNVTNNINAMDSASFSDFLNQNHDAVGEAFILNMDRSPATVDRLRANL